jgi:hypothetical protein
MGNPARPRGDVRPRRRTCASRSRTIGGRGRPVFHQPESVLRDSQPVFCLSEPSPRLSEHVPSGSEHAPRDPEHAPRRSEHAPRDAEHVPRRPGSSPHDSLHVGSGSLHVGSDSLHVVNGSGNAPRSLETIASRCRYVRNYLPNSRLQLKGVFHAVFGGTDHALGEDSVESPGGTAEISRGQDRPAVAAPGAGSREVCVLKGRWKGTFAGLPPPRRGGFRRGRHSGGGACGLPPANFLGSSRAIQKPIPQPPHSTGNSRGPR